MSQHLTRSPSCTSYITSGGPSAEANNLVISAGPHAPILESDESITTCDIPNDVEEEEHPDPTPDDNSMENGNELDIPNQPNLQDVVSFPVAFTSSAYHEVQLLKLLHGIGAPNYAFKSFMDWGRNCTRDEYHFQPRPSKYESQISNLTELVGMAGCRPSTIPVCLEPDNLTLDVVVFPFQTMLASLLNCPIINKLENFVVNPNDRFGRYKSPDGLLDEVNSGKWYQDTYDQCIKDGDKEFLAPIIFTMDKTTISEASHLSVYVILFTTSIYNREVSKLIMYWLLRFLLTNCWCTQTRNKAIAWRPLAYIPDQEMYYSKTQREKMKAPVKLIRLFKLYSVALQSFKQAQQSGVMKEIYLVIGDKAKYVDMKIPLAFIIGDNQGGDMIAGRTCSYGLKAKRLCRTCDATPENYGDVSVDSCTLLRMEDIMDLVRQEQWVDLELLYQAQFWNPFFDLHYGSSSFGIFFAACPPEGLHALEQGIFKHLLHEVLGTYLKPQQIALLDRVVQSWVKRSRQRLYRSANFAESPRLMFKDGISSLSNTSGCDRAGMVFALTIASLTRDGKAAFKLLDEDITQDITNALEMLMCYWAWLKHDKFWKLDSEEQMENVKVAVSRMLEELITCIPRYTGNGWNIPKIHEQLHIPYYIQMFGAHRNLHTGPTEHNHIELSKNTAKRTQMRAKEFDFQVANRLVDKLVVELADATMSEDRGSSTPEETSGDSIPHNAAVFDMLFWADSTGNHHVDMVTPERHGKFMPSLLVLQCLTEYCLSPDKVNRGDGATLIRCVTELRKNDLHLRANPVEKDGEWFDNIVVQGVRDVHGISSSIVGNLKFMFFFPEHPEECFGIVHPAYGYQPQHSVLTHLYRMEYEDDTLDILNSREHINRKTGSWILDDDRESIVSCPRLTVVCLNEVKSHLLMIPYHDNSKFMFGIIGQSLWGDKFVTY
jgi:hypothetical protein